MKYFINAASLNWEKSQLREIFSLGDGREVVKTTSLRETRDLVNIYLSFLGVESKDIFVFTPPMYTTEGAALLEELSPKGITTLSQAGWFDPGEEAWATLPNRKPSAGEPVKWEFVLRREDSHGDTKESRMVDFFVRQL